MQNIFDMMKLSLSFLYHLQKFPRLSVLFYGKNARKL